MTISFMISLIVICYVISSCFGQLSEKTKIQTILNTNENKDSLNFVAVFLLTTLSDRFFKSRVTVSRKTWGHPVKHFYAVTGENAANRLMLRDTKRCHDHTEHYRKITKHILPPTREEVYICDGLHVLHLRK
jgi:hypothetical protein